MERRRPKYHAHVDCFSGAAGDMLLAACLDAADSLPAPLLGISADADGDKNSDKFLTQLVHDLEGGLPELKGEFELSVKRVWRGVGRIAAKKVDVHSVYNHDAAPVPGARVNVEEVGGEVHSHEHTHEEEGKMHSHEHEHHTHNHCHNQEEQEESGVEVGDTTDEGLKRDPHGDSHSHSHGHSHSHNHSHSHSHSHSHQSGSKLRNLPQITRMLKLAPSEHIPHHVASLAIEAFTALAIAEMHTHGAESIDQVHFHEVGAVDSIVDTVGTLLALNYLGVDLAGDGGGTQVTCSPLPLGEGNVWTDHGLLPVPAPATMRLMIGMPTCPGPKGVTGELVTPTAAALLRVLTGVSSGQNDENSGSYWQPKEAYERPPSFIPRAVGIGAGTKDFERHPNILRLILGEALHHHTRHGHDDNIQTGEKAADAGCESHVANENNDTEKVSECLPAENNFGEVSIGNAIGNKGCTSNMELWDMHSLTHMQANIDDATPELLAHNIEMLLSNGAIDAWVNPIVMKKGRSAHSLNCICRCDEADDECLDAEQRLLKIMFRHSTTLGIRIHRNILRAALKRRFVEVQLPHRDDSRDGKVDVKISSFKDGEVVSVKAEFDHCKVISEENCIPLKIISSMAERLAWDHHVTS